MIGEPPPWPFISARRRRPLARVLTVEAAVAIAVFVIVAGAIALVAR